jgi:hypothetical protein
MKLLASAGSIEGIKSLIEQYYMGSQKELNQTVPGTWEVHGKSGILSSVRVIFKRGRYRFERVS